MFQRLFWLAALLFLLASCATGPSVPARQACEATSFTLVDNFAGARRGRCAVTGDDVVRISILPESDGYINDSAWYAFKLVPKTHSTATIIVRYRGGHHRYAPKISYDGISWAALPDEQVQVSSNRRQAVITLPVGDRSLWIAGGELLTPPIYAVWNTKMAATGQVQSSILGESLGGHPVTILRSNNGASDVLFLVGRQHPPEVTGAIAFFAFYEALMADSELARRFRQAFHIAAIPLLNPDGVIGGNWRHNLGSTDLNRDWGPFRQPETRLVESLLDDFDNNGMNVRVFLDFHSTRKNVFYTQNDANPTEPPHFTRTWLENAKPRIENYTFDYEENPVDNIGVAKNYLYKRYGIPSSTYEVGDNTDRAAIRAAAKIFAEELMELMLAEM